MNRRIILALVFLVGTVTGGAVVPHVLPQPAVAQDAPAEVTLVQPGDDDAVWVAGGQGAVAGVFTIYQNGTVTARDVAEDYRAVLDHKTPQKAFEALLGLVGEG